MIWTLAVVQRSLVSLTGDLFAAFDFSILDVLPPSTPRALSDLLDKEGRISHQEPLLQKPERACTLSPLDGLCSEERERTGELNRPKKQA